MVRGGWGRLLRVLFNYRHKTSFSIFRLETEMDLIKTLIQSIKCRGWGEVWNWEAGWGWGEGRREALTLKKSNQPEIIRERKVLHFQILYFILLKKKRKKKIKSRWAGRVAYDERVVNFLSLRVYNYILYYFTFPIYIHIMYLQFKCCLQNTG